MIGGGQKTVLHLARIEPALILVDRDHLNEGKVTGDAPDHKASGQCADAADGGQRVDEIDAALCQMSGDGGRFGVRAANALPAEKGVVDDQIECFLRAVKPAESVSRNETEPFVLLESVETEISPGKPDDVRGDLRNGDLPVFVPVQKVTRIKPPPPISSTFRISGRAANAKENASI